MNEDELRETVSVQLPRWRFGPWRWGPQITVQLIVSYQPSQGFITMVVGLDVPDRDQRFLSLLVPVRHALLKRHKSMESITRQHRRQPEVTGDQAGQLGAPGTPGRPPIAAAAAPAPAVKPNTGIFRMPKQDISTRITRLREQRHSPPPQIQTPPWIKAQERRSHFLVEEAADAAPAQDAKPAPTYTVVAEATPTNPTTTVFRLRKEDITERLERFRRGDSTPPPSANADDKDEWR
jgi:hypothetical protein